MIGLNLGNLVVHLRANTLLFDTALRRAEFRLKRMSASVTALGRKMTMGLTLPIVGLGAAALKSFSSFDDAMIKSLAIFGDVSNEMREQMRQLAIDMSKRTTSSATTLAKGYFYLGSAGLTAAQAMEALGIVNTLAIAGSFDLSKATELVTDAQGAMGLESTNMTEHMKNMIMVTDVLVGANTLARSTTEQFSEALQRAGPLMRAYGISITDGIAALAAYANQGKKGMAGGEMFARMIRLSVKAMMDNEEAWNKYEISLVDANDKMRQFSDIGRDLTNALKGMGVMARARALDLLGFKARSQQAIFPLLGMGDAMEIFETKLKDMGGRALELATKNMKSFSAQMKIIWNNITAFGMSFGQVLAPKMMRFGEGLKRIANWFEELNKQAKNTIVNVTLMLALIGPGLLILGLFIKSFGTFLLILRKTVSAMVATVTFLMTPFGAILGVVLLLVALAYTLRAAWEQNVEAIRNRIQWLGTIFNELYLGLSEMTKNFLTTYVSSWWDANESISQSFKNFVKDVIAGYYAIEAWRGVMEEAVKNAWTTLDWANFKDKLKAGWVEAKEAFAQSFGDMWDSAGEGLDSFLAKIKGGYNTFTLYLSSFIGATVEHLEDVLEAVKLQVGEDLDWLIDLLQNKIDKLKAVGIDVGGAVQSDLVAKYNQIVKDLAAASKGIGAQNQKVKFAGVSDVWKNISLALTGGEKIQVDMLKTLKDIDAGIEEQTDILKDRDNEGPVR